ncbi:TPA: neuraminidase-like domain-containing protein [Salmonella enterica]
MNIDIAASLNQRKRDALLSYYLGQYVPARSNPDLVSLVQTPEDVYEYLLIDPLVSNAVPTSRVAQAMSSIQQYINGITMNMEPGYTTRSLDPENISNWKGGLSQYDIWAGEVALDTYPENYIDPTLRQSQTTYFKELITDLNQNAINDDTAHKAVMNYLNKFEQVANLTVVSGYRSGISQTEGIYYFLGKNINPSVQYYWRSFDINKSIEKTTAIDAWTEWYPANLSINEKALIGKPRLTFFNNRLYIFWFEKSIIGKTTDDPPQDTHEITLFYSFSDFNNSWVSPVPVTSIREDHTNSDGIQDQSQFFADDVTNTYAAFYPDNTLGNAIYVSLFKDATSKVQFNVKVDYWFNAPETGVDFTLPPNLDTSEEQNRIQCDVYDSYSVSEVKINSDNSKSEFPTPYTDITNDIPVLDISNLNVTSYHSDDSAINLHFNFHSDLNSLIYSGTSIFNYNLPAYSVTGTALYTETDTSSLFQIYAKVTYSNAQPYTGGNYLGVCFVDTGSDIINGPALAYSDSDTVYELYADISLDKTLPNLNGAAILAEFSFLTSGGITLPFIIAFEYKEPEVLSVWQYKVYAGKWDQGELCYDSGVVPALSPMNISGDTVVTIDSTNPSTAATSLTYGATKKDVVTGREYSVYNSVDITLIQDSGETPAIQTGDRDATLGTPVYLDFMSARAPVRLNTLFAKELINKANTNISELLKWETQFTLEPPMQSTSVTHSLSLKETAPTPMDFYGANGIYFWELFFYMPYLVANRLSQEQQSAALSWYNHIFDPAARGRTSDDALIPPAPDYWSVRPLVETPTPGAQASAVWLTTDPDALAQANPVHYQKTIFMAYVDTLMAAADASYRLLTNDGLSLARLQYGQVRDLLGPRPDSMIINHWVPESLEALAAGTGNSAALTGFEQQALALPAFPGQASAADEATTSDAFMAPVNTQLLRYWNILDSRLYNLHHWLTIDGQPLNIPLYAPPVNPTLLMEQSVQGGSLISTAAGGGVIVPPYRFVVMLQSARTAATILSQFGQTLLSYCERQDAVELQELDAQQLFNLSGYTLQLQQNAIDALDKDQAALGKSRDMAQGRQDHYQNLYNQNVSSGEITAMTLQDSSSASITAASPFITAGMAMRTIPNIFGLAVGGEDIGAPTIAVGMVLQLTGEILGIAARQTETSENYKRRREEWQILYQQAQSEVGVINAQMEALAVRRTGAVTALNLATQQQANLKTTLNFLTTRFTQSALYNWLTGQLSALYYQAYDATLSLCLSAEASWQYEMGDITSRFIQTGTWNDNYRGLLVGETLQLNLQQMESAWLNRYTRRLELTKTVSLKNITDSAGTLQINWATFTTGAAAGTATFSLSESLFDKDYPGHYLRQIKSITVSLPALVGPYQDVRLMLTQSGSRVLLKPDINGVNYLNDPTKGSAASILTNPRASQQVAVSSGLNDAGLFVLNFGDERYLPFEGTGAVSDWQIAFPNPTSAEQKALLASLNDVIVQVHYTAVYGGSSFEQLVSVL